MPKKSISKCMTITFGDVAENHVGMQKIGEEADSGFSYEELVDAKNYFKDRKCKTKIYHLRDLLEDTEHYDDAESAYLLVVKSGLHVFGDMFVDALTDVLESLKWDTFAKMRGVVKNKRARYNLCFGEENQESNFENGKGTVVAFEDIPDLLLLRDEWSNIIGDKGANLMAEGNLYYDTKKCGIGYHGDSERNLVIACRLGDSMELHYQWYLKFERVGYNFSITLDDGDIYFMSEKAVGKDWKKRNTLTLRHAAGCSKYTK